ncbi:MAG: MBL fold metallo-hydrolase [Deltaproteobacteria bacterium]|nr:MBL fold metallo-hydrolase [Deltaproteobacteria bacterium]
MPELVATTETHPLPDGEVRLLGAVRCVTGAMTRVDTGDTRLLVDCGIVQGREARDWVFPEAAHDADALVLTHGHLDHVGSLPVLLDHGWDRPIFATAPTLEITAISLEDSLEMADASNKQVRDTLQRFRKLAKAVPYDTEIEASSRVKLAFREAGHILGSASVEIHSPKSRVILSGDLGRPESPILRDPNTQWSSARPIDVVVMESTYGARSHARSHDDVAHDLEEILAETIASKGKVLIPAFAIGRTQVLLYFLDALVEAGRLPDVPVAIDTPMGLAITETYKRFRRLYDKESLAKLSRGDDPLDFDDLFAVRKGQHSARVREMPGPMVVIAGSGMCTGGRIIRHLVDGLPEPENTVLFVGHQAEGTPGRRIQDAGARAGEVNLGGERVKVRARIRTLAGLSAHADRDELLAWLSHMPNVRRVALHHGEVEAQEALVAYARGPSGA